MRWPVHLIAMLAVAQMSLGHALAAETKPVAFGAVYDLTGAWSALGIPSSRGARLFVNQANKDGGVLGRPLKLIVKDTGGGVEKAAAGVHAILSEQPDVAAVFGLSDSDPVRAAATVAAAANRAFVTSGATSPKLPAAVPTYLFLACFGDNVQAAAAAEFAFSSLKARSVSIVYDGERTYPRLLQGYFKSSFEALGGAVRSVVKFEGPGKLGAVTDRILDADIIFLAAESPADSLQTVKTLRARGFNRPIVGGDGYDGETLWQQDKGLKDIYYTTHAYFGGDHSSALVRKFREAYAAAYGKEQPGSFAGLGYDAAALLAAAVKKAASTAPEKVLAALSSMQDFEGVTGTISFVDGSRIPLKSVTILGVSNGERHFVEQLVPTHVPSP